MLTNLWFKAADLVWEADWDMDMATCVTGAGWREAGGWGEPCKGGD